MKSLFRKSGKSATRIKSEITTLEKFRERSLFTGGEVWERNWAYLKFTMYHGDNKICS